MTLTDEQIEALMDALGEEGWEYARNSVPVALMSYHEQEVVRAGLRRALSRVPVERWHDPLAGPPINLPADPDVKLTFNSEQPTYTVPETRYEVSGWATWTDPADAVLRYAGLNGDGTVSLHRDPGPGRFPLTSPPWKSEQ